MPGAALVIVSLTMFVVIGGLPTSRVLAGYASPAVWLVFVAMLMSRALRDSGLSRLIALIFVRMVGRTSLGVDALAMTDVFLASGMSITARSGGIVLPVARGIAELYDSRPGPTANRLGRFLMMALYQGSAVSCAMFLTGQARLPRRRLRRKARRRHRDVVKLVCRRLDTGTRVCRGCSSDSPQGVAARDHAHSRGHKLRETATHGYGRMTRDETIALIVFTTVCLLWMTTSWHGYDVSVVALGALGALLVTNVLTWQSALREQPAWDIFIGYGGLLTMGEVLNETGSTTAFAQWAGGTFSGMHGYAALLLTLVVYFYAHYAFASVTAHALAMFQPFVVMLIGLGAPPLLAVYSLACMANLTAGLTHYGTTTAPIAFAEGYVGLRDWWKVGLLVSFVTLRESRGSTVGFAWWKLLGFW